MQCEWPKCERPATVEVGEVSDSLFCHGHAIFAEANSATYGVGGIDVPEYIDRVRQGQAWLKENPNGPS